MDFNTTDDLSQPCHGCIEMDSIAESKQRENSLFCYPEEKCPPFVLSRSASPKNKNNPPLNYHRNLCAICWSKWKIKCKKEKP